MFLLKDPYGDGTIYNGDFRYNDPKWTGALLGTVPLGIDPTSAAAYGNGIFAVPLEQW